MITTRPALAMLGALILLAAASLSVQAAGAGRPKLDANGDGYVDRDEVAARSAQVFDQLDGNHDGFLSPEELASGRKPTKAGASASAAGNEAARAARAAKRFARLDTNGDGRISREEFRAPREAMFDRLDKDKDGRLSADERPQRRKRG